MTKLGAVSWITGILCAIQICWSMMWAVWGAPIRTTHYLALGGALALVGSGILIVARWKPALWVAVGASLLCWGVYVPALVALFGGLGRLGPGTTGHLGPGAIWALVPPALLMASSVLLTREILASRRRGATSTEGEPAEGRTA